MVTRWEPGPLSHTGKKGECWVAGLMFPFGTGDCNFAVYEGRKVLRKQGTCDAALPIGLPKVQKMLPPIVIYPLTAEY